jgi:predicted nucleotidyltransferase
MYGRAEPARRQFTTAGGSGARERACYDRAMATPEVERFAAPLADLVTVAPSVQLVVLFGSVARGRARRDSDLDVAVRADEPADLDALYVLLAPRLASSRVDLVDLRRAGPLLAFQVAQRGQVLYERDPGAFRTFQSLASRRYVDTET